jgi:glucose/arabinose dehydrogenase
MRFIRKFRLAKFVIASLGTSCVITLPALAQRQSNPATESKSQACANDDSGLMLPDGFCATIFADDLGHARHLVVAPNGVIYVNTWSDEDYGDKTPPAGGFLVALQDKKGAGKADVIERFGETVQSGGKGGTGIALYNGSIYAEINDRIVRYSLDAGSIVPKDPPVTILSGLPLGGDHPMHPFIINSEGSIYVDVGSATNSTKHFLRRSASLRASATVKDLRLMGAGVCL